MASVMKAILRIMIGFLFAAVLAAAFSTTCFAGPEPRAKIKEDTKAAVEKTKEVAKEVAAKAKEVAGETRDKVKEAVKEVTQ